MEIHTNRIEGAWKHAKEHFSRMSGTKISQFDGHICEIMWRAEAKSNVRVHEHHLQSEWPTSTHLSNLHFPKMVWAGLQFSTWGMGN